MLFKGSDAFAAALALVCCALIPGSSSAQGKVEMWECEQVFLEPVVTPEGSIVWSCGGTFADKQLPAACRDGELPIYGSDAT